MHYVNSENFATRIATKEPNILGESWIDITAHTSYPFTKQGIEVV